MERERWMAGYYRINNGERFAGIRRHGRKWHVEIRQSSTGNLLQYAGIWDSLHDASKEAEWVLSR